MRLFGKAMAFGVGATLAYGLLVMGFVIATQGATADWTAHPIRYKFVEFTGGVLLLPLLPGALPGLFVGALLQRFGVMGIGIHDGGLVVVSAISAPIVHSCIIYRWLKRRAQSAAS